MRTGKTRGYTYVLLAINQVVIYTPAPVGHRSQVWVLNVGVGHAYWVCELDVGL